MCRLLIVLLLALPALEPPRDADLLEGIRQVEEGDFEAALPPLDIAARRLAAEPARARERAQALLFLGVAYLGLSQENLAKTKFQQAASLDTELQPSALEFPPKVLKLFAEARAAQQAAAQLTQEAGRKRGRGSLVLLGLGGAAAAAIAVTATTGEAPNKPPGATFVVSPTGEAIAGVTVLTFRATASDADNDPLGFTWSFGDGTNGSAETVTHVYEAPGSFEVTLSVNDGRGGTASARGAVTVRTLSGLWIGDFISTMRPFCQLDQQGRVLTGLMGIGGRFTSPALEDAITGSVADPRSVSFRSRRPDPGICVEVSYSFQGTAEPTLNQIVGVFSIEYLSCPRFNLTSPIVLQRQ